MNGVVAAPDLLRRFVPTLYVLNLRMRGVDVRLETNDEEIAGAVMNVADVEVPGAVEDAFLWKLVRDADAPPPGPEMTIISTGELVVLSSGGTIVCIDRTRRELLGFVGADVRADELAVTLIAVMLDTMSTVSSKVVPEVDANAIYTKVTT